MIRMDDATRDEPLVLGDLSLTSRLLVGTGKYANLDETARALELSGTEMVTVAIRRRVGTEHVHSKHHTHSGSSRL